MLRSGRFYRTFHILRDKGLQKKITGGCAMTKNIKKEDDIYGLVINLGRSSYYYEYTSFYASPSCTVNRDAVIEEAEKLGIGINNKYIFRCLPSDNENGFRLEPVEGGWRELITNRTSVQITPEILSLDSRKSIKCYGGTFAHFIMKNASDPLMTTTDWESIPFHLFSSKILSLKNSKDISIATLMAEAGVFPADAANDKIIDSDPSIPYFLVERNGHLGKDFFDMVLTKKRLMHSYQTGHRTSFCLASKAFEKGLLPDAYKYDPDILAISEEYVFSNEGPRPVLQAFIDKDPNYLRDFPISSITIKLLEAKDTYGNKGMVVKVQGKQMRLKKAFAEAGKLPEDGADAMLWLTSGNEGDEKVRAAELFYQLEYPDIYKEIIQSVRDSYRKQCSPETNEDFVERYIF
jgi:hypothetical protein